jgi:NO-binding membrane sensor protein with MHYT domain
MFRVLTCLTVEHDWRLVAVVCLFASLTAVNLFNRARATAGRARAMWIVAAAIATGFGIWATHFVAMLAYEPGIPIAYNLRLTVLSLAAAAFITGSGLGIAVYLRERWAPPLAGAVVGGGIAAMHYIGMYAIEIPGHVSWQIALVLVSITFGMVLGALAIGRCHPLVPTARRSGGFCAAHACDRVPSLHGHGRSRDCARSHAHD